ncbi:MAG: alginate export family protein [bacterium]|nr:alginate export family protein [bacterium]
MKSLSYLLVTAFAVFYLPTQAFGQDNAQENNPKIGLDLRSRTEFWNTPVEFAVYDNPYGFTLIRGRSSIDYTLSIFKLHGSLQGASAINLPDNAFLGPGKSYFDSAEKKNPQNFSIQELYIKGKTGILDFSVGRIPIKDGAEVLYDNAKFNLIKEISISERLVGKWDWTNLGRRFDGGTLGLNTEDIYIFLFGARSLSGGFDFSSAYSALNILVGGGSLTLKKDLIENTEIRVFSIIYNDERDIIKNIYGKNLFLITPGISGLSVQKLGEGEIDIVIWGAYQIGDFGVKKQQAFSLVAELGYEFREVFLEPWIRVGIAYATGENNPEDNTNRRFFNILPTNHKYYGYLDLFALSNLQNTYFQLFLSYDILKFEISFHIFSLASTSDKWIYGSGAPSKNRIGYSEINYTNKNAGNELDLAVYLNPTRWFSSSFGFSVFLGSNELKNIFQNKSNATWIFSQINLSF